MSNGEQSPALGFFPPGAASKSSISSEVFKTVSVGLESERVEMSRGGGIIKASDRKAAHGNDKNVALIHWALIYDTHDTHAANKHFPSPEEPVFY